MNSFLLLILTSIAAGVCIPLIGMFMAKIGIIEPFSIYILKNKVEIRRWRAFSPTVVEYSTVHLDGDITITSLGGSSTSEAATMTLGTLAIFSFPPALHKPQTLQLRGFIASATAVPNTITEKSA